MVTVTEAVATSLNFVLFIDSSYGSREDSKEEKLSLSLL